MLFDGAKYVHYEEEPSDKPKNNVTNKITNEEEDVFEQSNKTETSKNFPLG